MRHHSYYFDLNPIQIIKQEEMGCVNACQVEKNLTRKQMLKTLSEKQKNYKQQFKTYAEFHTTNERRKSDFLAKCSSFNNNLQQPSIKSPEHPYQQLQFQVGEYQQRRDSKYNKTIVLLAKIPSKKVGKQEDVLFVDGRLVFLTETPKEEPQQDSGYLLKILKDNDIDLVDFLSGNREEILQKIRQKQESVEGRRRQRIINQYFDDQLRQFMLCQD